MRMPATRARTWRAATALAALLALCACETVGLASLDPSADGSDETGTATGAAAQTDPGPADEAGSQLAQGAPATGEAGSEADPDGTDAGDSAEADPEEAAAGAGDELAATDADSVLADAAAAAAAPHVYMSLQPDSGGSTSVVFAIDRSRDGTPSDEPAIRITPEATEAQAGRCNPQQLRYYRFPPESADEPVYGPEEASRGVGARDLPGFMATAVSAEMMERGIARDLEATRPQNVCTRKLFEQTIIAATTGQG